MNTEPQPTPIVTPIKLLLTSRKFITALVTGIINLLVIAVPSLEPVQNELVTTFTALGLAIILGIAHEDNGAKSAPTYINAPAAGDVTVTPPANDAATSGQG